MAKKTQEQKDIQVLRDKGISELKRDLNKAVENAFDLRTELMSGSLKDKSTVSKARKKIARIMTAIREKEIIKEAHE